MTKRGKKWKDRNRSGWSVAKEPTNGGYVWQCESEVEEAPGVAHFI